MKKFGEVLYNDSRKVGFIWGSFSIMNMPQLQQMGTGVITENGIEKKSFSDFLLSQPNQRTAELPPVVAKLRQLFN